MGLSTLPSEIVSLNTLSKQDELAPGMLHVGTDLEPRLRLFLAVNLFTKVPSSILDLRNLRLLSLRNNKLTSIPAGIRDLVNLESLNVAGNQLTELPCEILNLASSRKLHELIVHPNPWRPIECMSDKIGPINHTISMRNGGLMLTRVVGADAQLVHSAPRISQESAVPSLTEMCLRQLRKTDPRGNLDLVSLMPPDSPQTVLDPLNFLQDHPGGQCATCQRPLVLAADEWLEWWYVVNDENFSGPSPRSALAPAESVPFRRLLCWDRCKATTSDSGGSGDQPGVVWKG
jgi:Leucine-rich repeat (LRR) protein